MRILALLTDGYGTSGGIGQYNRDLMAALAKSTRVESVMALVRHGSVQAEIPLKLSQLPAAPGKAAFVWRTLRTAVTERFDFVFCGHLYMAPLAVQIARLSRRPLWLQVHGVEAWERPGNRYRQCVQRAQLVTAVSRYTRNRLLQWSNIAPESVKVLPNTFAPGFQVRKRDRELATRLGLLGRRVLLTVGRMSASERYKGHDRILAVLPRVAQRVPDVCYLVVGGGDDVARLKQMAQTMGFANRVVFTGEVPADGLLDHFALADAFAMPSTGEGFGIVFLQAAACGLPVIGGNRDGSTDALAEGRVGLAIDPCDPAALADAIVDGLQGRLNPRPDGVEVFSFENYTRQVDELIGKLA